MRFPRGEEVPFTSGISGIVFVVFVFKFGSTTMLRDESIILGAWGVIYLIEWAVRSARRRRSVEGDVHAGAALDTRQVDTAAP